MMCFAWPNLAQGGTNSGFEDGTNRGLEGGTNSGFKGGANSGKRWTVALMRVGLTVVKGGTISI